MRSLVEMEKEGLPIHKAYLVSCVNSRLEDLEAAAAVVRGKKVAEGVRALRRRGQRRDPGWPQRRPGPGGSWWTPEPRSCLRGAVPASDWATGLLEDGRGRDQRHQPELQGPHGLPRLAQAYLASPEVVVASAVAGRVVGPEVLKGGRTPSGSRPDLDYHEFEAPVRDPEEVEILAGFPTTLTGRLVFVPADNLNTDGIYSKDYTYGKG